MQSTLRQALVKWSAGRPGHRPGHFAAQCSRSLFNYNMNFSYPRGRGKEEKKRIQAEPGKHEDKKRSLALLQRPKQEIKEVATQMAMQQVANPNVLQELSAVGLSFYDFCEHFVIPEGHDEHVLLHFLSKVPQTTREAIAALCAGSPAYSGTHKIFDMKDGVGEYALVVLRKLTVPGHGSSFCVMACGASFECAKVVECCIDITEQVPEESVSSVVKSKGIFTPEMENVKLTNYRTVYKTRQEPIFKQHVLDVAKMSDIQLAMEVKAGQAALHRGL